MQIDCTEELYARLAEAAGRAGCDVEVCAAMCLTLGLRWQALSVHARDLAQRYMVLLDRAPNGTEAGIIETVLDRFQRYGANSTGTK